MLMAGMCSCRLLTRDRMIYLRDFRAASHFTSRLEGHKQEVCGLKWSFDNVNLASGGNDNKVRAATLVVARAQIPLHRLAQAC